MSAATAPYTMNPAEQAALEEQIGGASPRLLLRTRTRVDTGRWLIRSRLWLCVTAGDLVLLAVAKRRYVEKIALSDCRKARYCHASGRLVLEDLEGVRFNHIDMTPTDALNVLSLLTQGEEESTELNSNEPEINRA